MKKESITSEQILEAYEAHGEDFLVLDIFPETIKGKVHEKLRTNKLGNVQYGDVMIKKADGTKVPLVIKFLQLTTSSRIRPPEQREYEAIKLCFPRDDPENNESKFGEAMELICKTFENKVEQWDSDGVISMKPKDKKAILKLVQTTPGIPMQFTRKGDGEDIPLDNPIMRLELKTRYYPADNLPKDTYKENYPNGNTVYIKDFDIPIADLSKKSEIEKKVKDRQTGEIKTVMKPFIPPATVTDINEDGDEEDFPVNNCNIQDFITVGSTVSGYVQMQIVISKQSFNLKTTFTNTLYVFPNDNTNNGDYELEEDEVDEMMPVGRVGGSSVTNTTGGNMSFSKTSVDEEEYEDDDIQNQLDELSD